MKWLYFLEIFTMWYIAFNGFRYYSIWFTNYYNALLLGFTTLFNILGHQRRFRHRAWKARQIFAQRLLFRLEVLLCAVNLRHWTHGFTSLPKEVLLGIFTLWKIHRLRPRSNPRTSDPEESMITTGPPGSTNVLLTENKGFSLRNKYKIMVHWKFPTTASYTR